MKRTLAVLVLICSGLLGCGSSKPLTDTVDNTRMKLQSLSSAYFMANQKTNRAPQKPEDLFPFFGKPDDLAETKKGAFRSDHDGEEFVVVWGTDLFQLAKQGKGTDFILMYERKGKGGTRYVLKPPTEVSQLTEEQFQKERFPAGHKPKQ